MLNLDEVMAVNDECIYKSSARVIQMFNNTLIYRYMNPCKVFFYIGYEFKRYFNHFIKDLDIKPVLKTVKKPQANAPVERIYTVILNIIVTKDIHNKVFDHIYPWGETLAYIAWKIRAFYHHTIMATPGQAVFDRGMLFNLA